LKPGDKFYVKGDYRTYTVESISVTTHRDDTEVVFEDKTVQPTGELMVTVRVKTEERTNPLVFDGADRVELT